MKFGQVFKEALRNEGFPPEWTQSAISYSQLKKCINRLTLELNDLGLDPDTLGKLLKHVEDYNAAADGPDDDHRPFEYILNDSDDDDDLIRTPVRTRSNSHGSTRKKTFQPKLVFHVDEATGALQSAQLDPKTKRKLQMLAVETGMTELRVFDESDANESDHPDTPILPNNIKSRPGTKRIEIPLNSDVEFFTKLTSELSGLEALQKREERRMHDEIEQLGKQIAHLTDPNRRANKKLLSVWRMIFQMYLEEGIFFGTTEQDHSAHNATLATERFANFCDKLAKSGLAAKLKKKENAAAFDSFMHINREILQGLRFGEINHTAMKKILKSTSTPHLHLPPTTNPTPRIRQTHRPRRQSHRPQTNRLPHLLLAPRQSRLRRSKHPSPLARTPSRRLQLPHVHGHHLATRPPLLQPRLLHPLPHRHAEQQAGPLPAVPRADGRACQLG